MTISLSVRADTIICGADKLSVYLPNIGTPPGTHETPNLPKSLHCHQRFIRCRHHLHGLCSLHQCGLRSTVVTPSGGDLPFLPMSLPQRSLGILYFAPGRKCPPLLIFWGRMGRVHPFQHCQLYDCKLTDSTQDYKLVLLASEYLTVMYTLSTV